MAHNSRHLDEMALPNSAEMQRTELRQGYPTDVDLVCLGSEARKMQYGPMRLAKLSKILGLVLVMIASPALANPELVIDVDSGQVLIRHQSTANWYPAALTTLMTVYVALHAVRDGRVSMDTPFVVSAHAANMPPSKMGFQPGVQVTLDNALKMLIVKSPNDIAVMVAEGISGSVEAFADEMNAAAARLGLKESHFVNPSGLPDNRQVTSARDMAMIGRALLKEFPEHNDLF
ncbi:MAG: serine hydrolase, partial [Roseiarcus sp.]